MKQVHIIGGGTVFHIRPHAALCSPVYGKTAWDLLSELQMLEGFDADVHLYTTKMAGNDYVAYHINGNKATLRDLHPEVEDNSLSKNLETNADVARLLDDLVKDPASKIIFLPAGLCDFEVSDIEYKDVINGSGGWGVIGKDQPRLRSDSDTRFKLHLKTSEKIIRNIRKERKDIFVVGFKTTHGATPPEQFEAGLNLLKKSSINLVLANDIKTRLNMIITPEQAPYEPTKDRQQALRRLVEMAWPRAQGRFTRSIAAEGEPVPWSSPQIPDNLRTVVNHCIKRGAYKPFLGATVGHFAIKAGDNKFITSRRKVNFNKLDEVGMVLVEALGDDRVISYGGKPSVGGQSQRIIFKDHPEMDCIVHFHCPMKPDRGISTRPQMFHECGSHECGENTSQGLTPYEVFSPKNKMSQRVKAVMLDNHGPNIVFSKDADPQVIIDFIEDHWDLARSTSEILL